MIASWRGVDKENSTCFPNKKNSSWNGWAIVHFRTESDRRSFLEDENQHYVRDSAGTCHKLKVTKWFAKPQTSVPKPSSSSSSSRTLPLYKADLFLDRETTQEEFERNCNESSIQSFRGTVQSYVTDKAGFGHNGFIEVKLSLQGRSTKEVVLFHSDSVWLCSCHSPCYGEDCVRKCGVDDYLPIRLKVGSEVVFTARKIPPSLFESFRFQAKSVWQGEGNQPNFISPPSSIKLDEYLDDYLNEVEGTKPAGKSPTPSSDSPSGNSPAVINLRQKPLQGSLKQLNSSLDTILNFKVQKKVVPTNFAQAVAAPAATVQVAESADFLEKGKVESFPNCEEVVVSVSGYGRFILDQRHFDGAFKDIKSSLHVDSNLVVALSHDKSGGKKSKFDVIRAFPETDHVKPYQDKSTRKETFHEDILVPVPGDGSDSGHSKSESHHDINLEDLDKYYDTFPEIFAYLQREIPMVLSNLTANSKAIERLANDIIYSSEESNETEILQEFFKTYPVTPTHKNIFISNYIKFRKAQQHPEPVFDEDNTVDQTAVEKKPVPKDVEAEISRFLKWIFGRSKSNSSDTLKLSLYKEFFTYSEISILWFNVVSDPEPKPFPNFIEKKIIGETGFIKLQNWIMKKGVEVNWPQIQKWLENDTNIYKSHLSKPDVNGHERERGRGDGDLKLFAGLKLSELETEFVACKEKERETHTFILRVLIMLRKTGITFDELIDFHQDHLRQSSKTRNREFNAKMHSFLLKRCSQGVLEETNAFIGNNKDLKIKEHTPVSCKKIDKFVPILTTAICGFLFEKANIPLWNGNPDKSTQRRTSNTPSTEPNKDEFGDLADFMRRDAWSNIAEVVLQTLKNRNIKLDALYNIFKACKEGGILKWNLEISKLQLNPPTGTTVFKIGEILWSFFNYEYKTEKCEPEGQSVGAEKKKPASLTMPSKLFSAYYSPEIKSLAARFRYGDLEMALQEGLEIMSELQSVWNDDDTAPVHLFSRLAGLIWAGCNVDKDALEQDISIFYKGNAYDEDCVEHLQTLLSGWGRILQSSDTLRTNSLGVYNLLKLTLASFDPNIYEDIQRELTNFGSIYQKTFMNIVCDQSLYSGEGIVLEKRGFFFVIQTKFCKVFAHPSVVFTETNPGFNSEQDPYALNLYDMVRVHSKPVENQNGTVVCYMALMVWPAIQDDVGTCLIEPPNSGPLLPFNQEFYKVYRHLLLDDLGSLTLELPDVAEFGGAKQLKDYDALWFDEKRHFDDPSWLRCLAEAKTYWVLYSLGYIDREEFERPVFSKMNSFVPYPYFYEEEFFGRLEIYLAGSEESKKMKIFHGLVLDEHGPKAAVDKFLEKYPSSWLDRSQLKTSSKSKAGSDSSASSETSAKVVKLREEDPGEPVKPVAISPQHVEAERLSEAEYRRINDQRLERLNSAVETLFQVVQETTATLGSIDKRVQAIEKVRRQIVLFRRYQGYIFYPDLDFFYPLP